MEILLDTNFILECAKKKIDFVSLTGGIVDEKIDWLVPQEVLNELGILKDKGEGGADKKAAGLGFEILEKIENVKVIELSKKILKNVDMGIVNYVLGSGIVVATMDRGLKNRLGGNRVLSVRGEKKVGFL